MTNSTNKLHDLELIINSIPDPIFIFDKDHILTKSYISDIKKVSFYQKECLNKKIDKILPSKISNLFTNSIEKTFFTKKPQTISFSLKTKKIKEYFEVDFSLIDKNRVLALIKNLTGSRIAEESLLQSEINFKKIQAIAHIGTWSWNIETNEYIWSDEIYRIFGAKPNEFEISTNILKKYIHPEDYKSYQRVIKYVLEDKVSYKTVYRIIQKNKKIRYIEERGQVKTDNSGKTILVIGTIQNVTSGKLAEKNKTEDELKIQSMFVSAPTGHGFTTGRSITEVNQKLCKITGYDKEELLNKNTSFLYSSTNEYEKIGDEISKQIANIGTASAEAKWKRKNGKIIDVLINACPIDRKDFAKGNTFSILDITENKKNQNKLLESEEKFRSLFDNSFDIIYSIDTRGKYKFVNPMWFKTLGYSPEELKDMKLTDVIHIETLDHAKYFITRALYGEKIKGLELVYITKRNKKIFVEENITPIFKNGKVVELQAFIRDITQRKLVEKELEKYRTQLEEKMKIRTKSLAESNKELIDVSQKYMMKSADLEESEKKLQKSLKKEKELNELKSRFISTTSHEFRTPLASINFSASFLRKYLERIEQDEMKHNLLKIEKQVKHMTNLLDDILLMERSQSDKIQIKPTEQKLSDFMLPIIEEVYNATLKTHQFRVSSICNKCKIYVDTKSGRKIFLNLLTNAVKFSPEKKYIDIKCSCPNNTTKIEIIDYGIGILKKEIERVFEPFHRSEQVESIQGTGLGLAIVKESIKKHNGTIDIDSKPGKGTKFTIILPNK